MRSTRPAPVLASALALALLAGCGPAPDECAEEVSVIDQEAWTLVPLEGDPFSPAEGITYPCDESDTGVEDLDGATTWTVVTGSCNWATAAQRLEAPLRAGDQLRIRVFWFSQTDFFASEATVGVAVGEDIVLSHDVPIPSEGELLDVTVEVPRDAPAGTQVCFHVGNHGSNSWNLLDIARVEDPMCAP